MKTCNYDGREVKAYLRPDVDVDGGYLVVFYNLHRLSELLVGEEAQHSETSKIQQALSVSTSSAPLRSKIHLLHYTHIIRILIMVPIPMTLSCSTNLLGKRFALPSQCGCLLTREILSAIA